MSTEFSRYFDVSLLQRQAGDYELQATPAENKALARRFGVHQLSDFKALIHVIPKGKALDLRGQFTATVHWYPSKDTLKEQDLYDEFDEIIIVAPAIPIEKQDKKDKIDEFINDTENLDLEIVAADSALDLGEIVAQYLGLALNDLTQTLEEDEPEAPKNKPSKPNPTRLGDFWPKKD